MHVAIHVSTHDRVRHQLPQNLLRVFLRLLTFLNQPLLWGLALVGVPVLIHLINLLRHKRVEWAAMEFLLESQRKNSAWIRFKELLLLLLRMAAVAAVVLIVAQPLLTSDWGQRFGGQMTHHVVLLDDSYSMSDRAADVSAFDEARAAIERIGQRAARESSAQRFTLLRFSRCGGSRDAARPDLLEEIVNTDFAARLGQTLAPMKPSQLATGPREAFDAASRVLGDNAGERRMVYLISDFRESDWGEPTELAAILGGLKGAGAEPFLVNCVRGERPNLSVAGLAPRPGTLAAGVPLVMDVTLANHGRDDVSRVTVTITDDANSPSALVFEEVPARSSVTRSFPAFFSTAGEHAVTASLEADAVLADNARHAVMQLAVSVPVLVIDGDPKFTQARLLARALAPGGQVKTGVSPRIEPPAFLNDSPLDGYAVIYLLNIEHLDALAVQAVEAFARQGRGVGIFLGERSRASFLNEALHREGQGLLPLPLVGPTQLLVDRLDRAPDIEVGDHPIFRVLSGERNSFLSTVLVDRYFAAPKDWRPPVDSAVKVIARLRNGAPLAVEQPFGDGRVVAFTTSVAGDWNNWARNPSFVAAMLDLQWYLSSPAAAATSRLVGAPLELSLDPARYRAEVRLAPPEGESAGSFAATAVPNQGRLQVAFAETGVAGIYETDLTTSDNQRESRRFAYNVDPSEGDLAIVSGPDLARKLEGVRYKLAYADEVDASAARAGGSNLSQSLVYLLFVVLLAEQALASALSYHAPAGAKVAA